MGGGTLGWLGETPREREARLGRERAHAAEVGEFVVRVGPGVVTGLAAGPDDDAVFVDARRVERETGFPVATRSAIRHPDKPFRRPLEDRQELARDFSIRSLVGWGEVVTSKGAPWRADLVMHALPDHPGWTATVEHGGFLVLDPPRAGGGDPAVRNQLYPVLTHLKKLEYRTRDAPGAKECDAYRTCTWTVDHADYARLVAARRADAEGVAGGRGATGGVADGRGVSDGDIETLLKRAVDLARGPPRPESMALDGAFELAKAWLSAADVDRQTPRPGGTTMMTGGFESDTYARGFCHGTVTARTDGPIVDGSTVAGEVTLLYEGSYRAGESVTVGVSVSRAGDSVRVDLRGPNVLARLVGLSFHDGAVSDDDGVLTLEYRVAMPADAGTVRLLI